MQKEQLIQRAIQNELSLHPQATLMDLYKFSFQGAFGPGHLIDNRESALQAIQDELEKAVEFDAVEIQPVGYQGYYYRINLELVKNGVITLQALGEAFIESARSSPMPSLEEWRKEWQTIIDVIARMQLELFDFTNNKRALETMMRRGEAIIHHSETYCKLYHPHYRLVNKRLVEQIFGSQP